MIEYYYAFQNTKYEKDEHQSQFSQLNKKTLHFVLFTLLQSYTTNMLQTFTYLFSI